MAQQNQQVQILWNYQDTNRLGYHNAYKPKKASNINMIPSDLKRSLDDISYLNFGGNK